MIPSASPTKSPTSASPSISPSAHPTVPPSTSPTPNPTTIPTSRPSVSPTAAPTGTPTAEPSIQPSVSPSSHPTSSPSTHPTSSPTVAPTQVPTPACTEILPSGCCRTDTNGTSTTFFAEHITLQGCEDDCLGRPSCFGYEFSSNTGICLLQLTTDAFDHTEVGGECAEERCFQCGSTAPKSVPVGTSAPTALPTSVPSVHPTMTPTGSPTGSPQSQPTVMPSTAPSQWNGSNQPTPHLDIWEFPATMNVSSTDVRITIRYAFTTLQLKLKVSVKREIDSVTVANLPAMVLPSLSGSLTFVIPIQGPYLPLGSNNTFRILAYVYPESASPPVWNSRLISDVETNIPTVSESGEPHSVLPTAVPAEMLASGAEMVIVRPFFDGDIDIILASFDAWDGPGIPCDLIPSSSGLTPINGPIDIILYYARNITEIEPEAMVALGNLNTSASSWRKCFGHISVLGANLTESQDVYNPLGTGVDWNQGPNIQFFRMAKWLESNGGETNTFFYMEGDTVPIAPGWLDALRDDAASNSPFAILGSRYSGHNWDKYIDATPSIIPDALKFHLNGNAVYNVTHAFVQSVVFAESATVLADVPQSSFDVRFCEVAMREYELNGTTLDSLGYRQTAVLANFASTLVIPSRVPATAMLLHGARLVHSWSSRQNIGGHNADLSLVVSDWGETNDLTDFMMALATATAHPFEAVNLITQDMAAASTAEGAYPSNLSAHSRDWSRGSAEWDLCSANVSTTWFVAISTYFHAYPSLELAVSFEQGKPMIPYKRRSSVYCDCVCKERIDSAARFAAGYEYDIASEHAVIHTATRNQYCGAVVADGTTSPSINGYFAFVLGNSSSEDDTLYTFYDRERYGVVDSFDPPVGEPSQCGADAVHVAPCIFPFKYRNVTYSNCTTAGTAAAYGIGPATDDGGRGFRASGANLPWCATSLTSTGEADDWTYCRADVVGFMPGNEGSRRSRRQSESVMCTSNGGSFTCVPTAPPTATPTVLPTPHPTATTLTPAPTIFHKERVTFYLELPCDANNEDPDVIDDAILNGLANATVNVSLVDSVFHYCGSLVGVVAFPKIHKEEADILRARLVTGSVWILYNGVLSPATATPFQNNPTESNDSGSSRSPSSSDGSSGTITALVVVLVFVVVLLILAVFFVHRRSQTGKEDLADRQSTPSTERGGSMASGSPCPPISKADEMQPRHVDSLHFHYGDGETERRTSIESASSANSALARALLTGRRDSAWSGKNDLIWDMFPTHPDEQDVEFAEPAADYEEEASTICASIGAQKP